MAKRLKRETNKGEVHHSDRKAREQNSIETSYKGGQPRIKISWPHKNYYFFDSFQKKNKRSDANHWHLLNSVMKNVESCTQSPTGLVAVNLLSQLLKINKLINLFT